MKKIISLFLALILVCCTVSMAAAVSEVLKGGTGDVGFPELGFRFTPPEAYRDTKGIIVMDGPFDLSKTVDVVFCTYLAMTEEEYAEFKASSGTVVVTENPY